MRLTPDELALLDAQTLAGRIPPPPPGLPGLGMPATLAALTRYRRARLGRDRS